MQTQANSPKVTVRKKELSAEVIHKLDAALRPSLEEIQGMIATIVARKNWNKTMIAAILSMSANDFRDYELGLKAMPGPALRALWYLYMLDTAPELAMSVVSVATWGKNEAALPRRTRTTPGTKEAMIKWIQNWENEPEYNGHKLTVARIAEKWGVSRNAVIGICKRIGYKPASGWCKSYRKKTLSSILRPESMWLRVNWEHKNAVIAEQLGVTVQTVKQNRRRFRIMPVAKLKDHLRACNIPLDGFEKIFRTSYHPRKYARRLGPMTPNFSI